jgi:hypothetical protein
MQGRSVRRVRATAGAAPRLWWIIVLAVWGALGCTAGNEGPGDEAHPSPPPTPSSSCGQIPTIEDDRSPTRVLHLAVDGNDGGDGSAGRPWASLQHAAAQLRPGDALRIHAGTYWGRSDLVDLRGTADAPIWVGGAPGEAAPTLDAGGASEVIHLSRPRYLVLHSMTLRGATDNGLNADDGGAYDDPDAARYVVFRDLRIEDIGSGGNNDCLKLSGLHDHWVLDSAFARCGAGGSAVDHVGCHRGVVARNSIRDMGSSGIQNKGGSTDIDILWNRFENAGARPVNLGGSTGLSFFRPPVEAGQNNAEARRIRVLGNLFEGGQTAAAFVGCVECVFAQNTVIEPERWVLRILQETLGDATYPFEATRDGRVVNNLVWFDSSELSRFVNVGPNTSAESFAFFNNLWFAHDDPSASAPDLPAEEAGGLVGQDPGISRGSYAIEPDSPAAGRGSELSLQWLDADIRGECLSDPPPIGAWSP